MATVEEVVSELSIELGQIYRFIKEGRLIITFYPNLGYRCEKCEKRIRENKICDTCAKGIREELLKLDMEKGRKETYHKKK